MADKCLAARPNQHRDAGRNQLRERGKELEVVANRLAEPDPGVDVDLRDASCTGLRDASLEISPDLTDNVVVMWIELHVRGHSSAMHRYEPGAMFGGNRRQARRDIVQQGCPAASAARATDALVVSIETRTSPESASTTGRTRCSSSSEGQLKHRTRRLTPDVDDVRTFGHHLAPAAHGSLAVDVEAAV